MSLERSSTVLWFMFPKSELFTCCLGSILNFYVKIKVLMSNDSGNLIVFGIAIILLLLLICMVIQKSNSCHPESAEPSNEKKKHSIYHLYDLCLKKPKGSQSHFPFQRWYALHLL